MGKCVGKGLWSVSDNKQPFPEVGNDEYPDYLTHVTRCLANVTLQVSEKEDNRMKNVPVPVYCRPLVEKDPNRKVNKG